jgi:HSP20 family protein
MHIIPWREQGALSSLRREMDRLMNHFIDEDERTNELPQVFRRTSGPAVDLAETEKAYLVSVELPGMAEKDVQVQLRGNQLVISGERKWEDVKKTKAYHRVESRYGAFERSIILPDNLRLDPDAISATFKNGVLEITVPKTEPTPAKQISIKPG